MTRFYPYAGKNSELQSFSLKGTPLEHSVPSGVLKFHCKLQGTKSDSLFIANPFS